MLRILVPVGAIRMDDFIFVVVGYVVQACSYCYTTKRQVVLVHGRYKVVHF
jgi:hypothetical protein